MRKKLRHALRKGRSVRKTRNLRRALRKLQHSPFYIPLTIFIPSYCVISIVVFFLEHKSKDSQFASLADSFWWTIVTASTLGYGDIVPTTPSGKIFGVFTVLMGIAVTSLFSAALISLYVQRNSRRRRGLMDYPRIKNHLIICGWKPQINNLLKGILEHSQDFRDEDIVLISNIEGHIFEDIQEEESLREVKFIRGDYFSEVYLERANVNKARKVIVLADTYDSKTPAEADAKTVLTVLKIKGINKDIYTCAELLDPKYEDHLRRSFCDEIILVRDASRQLLVASAGNNGMSHVIQELLSLHENRQDGIKINAVAIPEQFVGKEYENLCKSYRGEQIIILGLIENTATARSIQSSLIRQAQKDYNVRNILEYIQEAKRIELNKPYFMPDTNYIIKPFTKLILLEKYSS